MIYVMSARRPRKGRSASANICAMAKEKDVPVFVDAAAEEPLEPNIHLRPAPRWSAIAAASACAGRNPPAC